MNNDPDMHRGYRYVLDTKVMEYLNMAGYSYRIQELGFGGYGRVWEFLDNDG
jgi:hypothetical protein